MWSAEVYNVHVENGFEKNGHRNHDDDDNHTIGQKILYEIMIEICDAIMFGDSFIVCERECIYG